MLLAFVVALHLTGAPQTVDMYAQAGTAYHIAIASHCDCYLPQPRMVLPFVEIVDDAGKTIAYTTTAGRSVQKGMAKLDLENDLRFTAPATGTYHVRVTPLKASVPVALLHERYSSATPSGGHSAVLTSHDANVRTPVYVSTTGDVTLHID
jgi:hypothetical protein